MASKLFGEYEVSESCGTSDGCAETLKASQPTTGKPAKLLCVKVCPFAAKQATDQIEEARHLRSRLKGLRHPHLLAIQDLAVEGEQVATVTNPVESITLKEYLERTHADPSLEARLDLLLPVGEALSHLHRGGYAHGRFGPESIEVLEVAGRAFISSLPPCATLGIAGEEKCHPELYPDCPSTTPDGGLPTAAGDARDFVAVVTRTLLRDGVTRELSADLTEFLHEAMEEAPDLDELLKRLREEKQQAQLRALKNLSPADVIRHSGLQRKESAQATAPALDATPEEPTEQLAGEFFQLSLAAQLAIILTVVVASAGVPVERVWEALSARSEAPVQRVTKPAPIARPAPPKRPTAPALPATTQKLLEVAEAAWNQPTDKDAFAPRLATVWAFVRKLPPDQRAELGGKKALVKVRRLAAKNPGDGHRELDLLIGRCRELLRKEPTPAE